MRWRNTASRSGSTTSTERTAAPSRPIVSRSFGRSRRDSTTSRSIPPSLRRRLADALDRPKLAGRRPEVAGGRELHAVQSADELDELAPGAFGDDPALVDDPDPVAEPLGLLHVVGRVEDPHPGLAELLDAREDRVPALRIDADGGLVEDQESWLVEQPDRDVEAALHAAGVVLGPLAGPVGEIDELQDRVDPLRQARAGEAVEATEEAEVLPSREVRVDRQVLRHVADRGLRLDGADVDRLAVDDDRARVAGEDAADHRDRRRLAGPVRAEEPVRLAPSDLERHAVDGLAGAELLRGGRRSGGLAARGTRPARRR